MPLVARAPAGTAVDPVTPVVLGVDHAAAPLAVRERLAAAVADLPLVLSHLRAHAAEAAVLSTCNRTEIYLVGGFEMEEARACLAAATRVPLDQMADCLTVRTGPDAAEHLFAVAAGVESQLVGETEILRQVREAHAAAEKAGASGPVLSSLFRHALAVGKKARARTGISRGAASVGSAAAAIVREEIAPAERHHAVLVGAGAAAERVLAHLRTLRFRRVDVVNRTVARAEPLAARGDGRAFGLEALPALLAEADVVVCATSAPAAVVHLPDAAAAVRARGGRPLLLLDLAVPRDVEPSVGDLPGLRLYDIDAVQGRAAADLERRTAEVAAVRALVEAEVAAFGRWLDARRAAPTIARLRAAAEARRLAELARTTAGLTPRERAAVDRVSRSLLNALLHGPTKLLRDGTGPDLGARLAEALEQARGPRP